ncbi:hypothetical protein ACC703_03880 [Rhizobium ruizarguesonis]
MHAPTKLHPGSLWAIRDVMERRAELIEEVRDRQGLPGMSMGSLVDILTISSFDDCCCGAVSARLQQRIVGWPSIRLRENVKRELRTRFDCDEEGAEEIEDAFERGFDLAAGNITVDGAWSRNIRAVLVGRQSSGLLADKISLQERLETSGRERNKLSAHQTSPKDGFRGVEEVDHSRSVGHPQNQLIYT